MLGTILIPTKCVGRKGSTGSMNNYAAPLAVYDNDQDMDHDDNAPLRFRAINSIIRLSSSPRVGSEGA